MRIQPAYQHSKAGTFLFNLCAKATEWLIKHKVAYYILACTWGLILTLIGWIISAALGIAMIFSKRISFGKYDWIYYINAGPDYWGGFEMGTMFVRDQKSDPAFINPHEFGHTFQNCVLGPLTPFLVNIPSAIRYWYRALSRKASIPDYDSVWFEDAATQCGKYAHEYLSGN